MNEEFETVLRERFNNLNNTAHYSKNGFELYVPTEGNTKEVGYFYVDSYNGHDSYAYDSVSTHTYYIISGEGDFIINGKVYHKQSGETIEIHPNEVFYYKGAMKLIEKISPEFDGNNFHQVKLVSYDKESVIKNRAR